MSDEIKNGEGLNRLRPPKILSEPDWKAWAEKDSIAEPQKYPEVHPALFTYAEERIRNRTPRDPEIVSRLVDWLISVRNLRFQNEGQLNSMKNTAYECRVLGMCLEAESVEANILKFCEKMTLPETFAVAMRARNIDASERERAERKAWKENP